MDQHEPTPDASPAGGRRRARSRWLRLLGDLLLIAGGLVLAYPLWSAAYAQVQQTRLDSTYRERSAAFVADAGTADETSSHEVSDEVLIRRLAAEYSRGLKAGDPVGRLRIPRIGMDRLVQQGVSGRLALDPEGDRALLRSGPVHYAITPLPGLGEPFGIAGHRTTYGAPFFKLDKLRKGDPILVETPYARFRYEVVKTTTVKPADVGVLRDRGYGLVLTTCTPPYSAERRLIVWAVLERARPLRVLRAH